VVLNRARIRQEIGVTSKTGRPMFTTSKPARLLSLGRPSPKLQHSGGAYTSRSCGIGRRVAPIGLALHLRPVRSTASSGTTGRVPASQHLRARTAVPR